MSGHHKKAYLEITNVCNLSCTFCPKSSRAPRALSEEEFLILANRLRPWAEYLCFHLMGEPTVHPLLPVFLEHAKKMDFRTLLTTNGTRLKQCAPDILKPEAVPYKISISLHAYEANALSVPISVYLDECYSFAKAAASYGTIVALRLWNLDGRASGAHNDQNQQILTSMHSAFPGEWMQNRSGYKLCDHVFLEWGEKFDWPSPDGAVLQETGFCYGLRDQIGVLCDGTVVPCCLDRDGSLALGNLFEVPLSEILSAPRAKRIYDGFTAHQCTEHLCRRCMRAGYYREQ